jgi:hypothetical protein
MSTTTAHRFRPVVEAGWATTSCEVCGAPWADDIHDPDGSRQHVPVPLAWQDRYGTTQLIDGIHHHVAVEVHHPRYGDALLFIDELIAPLIAELMAAGFTTVESCQGHGAPWREECVLIAFADKRPRWQLPKRLRLVAKRWRRPLPYVGWEWDEAIHGNAILLMPPETVQPTVDLLRLYSRPLAGSS